MAARRMQVKVREVMSTPPISVSPDTDVRTIARLLVKNDVDGVPVVDAAGRVLGMVTESDLIVRNANLHFPRFLQIMDARIFLENPRHFEEETRKMLATTASDLMTAPPVVVSAGDEMETAATIMVEKHHHALPVVEAGKLVGVISRSDLVKLMAEEETAS